MKKKVKCFTAILLALAILSASAYAALDSNAYISSGEAHIARKGGGKIAVEFTVIGTDIMDTIGAHLVTVYRATGDAPDVGKDELIDSFYYKTYTGNPPMMGSETGIYNSNIPLTVESGERYYATLVFYASLDGDGDDMWYTTKIVTA